MSIDLARLFELRQRRRCRLRKGESNKLTGSENNRLQIAHRHPLNAFFEDYVVQKARVRSFIAYALLSWPFRFHGSGRVVVYLDLPE